ncbi:MFS transporter [Arthrobacter sp. Z1-15]
MSNSDHQSTPVAAAATVPSISLDVAQARGAEELRDALAPDGVVAATMPAKEMVALFAAQLALFMALVTPAAFSLPIKIGALDPANKGALLALTIGVAATFVLVTNPVAGVLSDRTRSRFGRRRSFFVGGLLVGAAGTAAVGFASSSSMIIVGWTIALVGYSVSNQAQLIFLGDRLPEAQRGKVMGIYGALAQLGPIAGIILAGSFTSQLTLMFLIPAAIALLGCLWFATTMNDPKFEGEVPTFRLTTLTRGFYFNPRKHPNFGWTVLSKFFVYAFLAVTSLYGIFVLTTKLGVEPAAAGSLIAVVSIGAVVVGIVGALAGGFLSDRLHSRKPFLVISAILLAASAVTIATATSVPQFIVGTLLTTFGIGVYGAVDQALALDTLPSEENENGRYLAIFGLANSVPQAIGPFAAGLVLALSGNNYSWVYYLGAALAVLAALTILPVNLKRQATVATERIPTTA